MHLIALVVLLAAPITLIPALVRHLSRAQQLVPVRVKRRRI